jgi:hypothetical protein
VVLQPLRSPEVSGAGGLAWGRHKISSRRKLWRTAPQADAGSSRNDVHCAFFKAVYQEQQCSNGRLRRSNAGEPSSGDRSLCI